MDTVGIVRKKLMSCTAKESPRKGVYTETGLVHQIYVVYIQR